MERLGGKCPNDVTSVLDDVKIARTIEAKGNAQFSEPSWQEQQKNQETYEKSSKNVFKVGTFVYLDNPQDVFDKSFHAQISIEIYTIFHFCANFLTEPLPSALKKLRKLSV